VSRGFPIEERFSPAEPAATFLRRHEVAGRPIALFVTHGASDDLPELQAWLDNCAAAASQLELVGVFHCQGELSEQMAQKMLPSTDERWSPGPGPAHQASGSLTPPACNGQGAGPRR